MFRSLFVALALLVAAPLALASSPQPVAQNHAAVMSIAPSAAALPFAQMAAGYSVGQWVLIAIVVIGIISILMVFIRSRGLAIPPEFITYAWIVLAVVVAVVAVKILLSSL